MMFVKQDIDPAVEARLNAALELWRGTPYRSDAQSPSIGADCRSFVLGVLDDLYNLETDIGSLPPDIALHQPETARAFLRSMARKFCCHRAGVKDGTIEPGDLIVTRVDGGGPTHIAIAGTYPWIWDCIPGVGVRVSGYDAGSLQYEGHWRLPNKHIWPQ